MKGVVCCCFFSAVLTSTVCTVPITLSLQIWLKTNKHTCFLFFPLSEAHVFLCVRLHRFWLKWNLTSSWPCATTSISSRSISPWLLGAPSFRGYKVRVLSFEVDLPPPITTTHWPTHRYNDRQRLPVLPPVPWSHLLRPKKFSHHNMCSARTVHIAAYVPQFYPNCLYFNPPSVFFSPVFMFVLLVARFYFICNGDIWPSR